MKLSKRAIILLAITLPIMAVLIVGIVLVVTLPSSAKVVDLAQSYPN
jgi:hypothetical protein